MIVIILQNNLIMCKNEVISLYIKTSKNSTIYGNDLWKLNCKKPT